MQFKYRACGSCCKSIKHITQLSEWCNADGSCKMLKDNLCTIYENRPMVCNVEKLYETCFKKSMPKTDYMAFIAEACAEIRTSKGE